MNGFFNKEKLIIHAVELNIYYQRHRERTEIDVIGSQKWSVILRILWLTYYNSEIDWKKSKVKMTRYLEEYKKQQKLKQGKLEQQKQKKKERNKKRKNKKRKG